MSKPAESNDLFSLRLSGEGISIEKSIDRETALAVVAVVLGGQSPAAAPRMASRSTGTNTPPLSLREFLDEVSASTKPDQITAIGHYICQHEGNANFSRDEIKSRYSTAREPMPANFSRDFVSAIKAGLIQEVHGERGRFYVTVRGAKAVENKFQSKGKQ